MGRPLLFGLLPVQNPLVPQRVAVAPREGVDPGMDFQSQGMSLLDEGLQVIPRGRPLIFSVDPVPPCSQPLHLSHHIGRKKHITCCRPHIHHHIGEPRIFGQRQITPDVLPAVGKIGEIGRRINPDKPRLLGRIFLLFPLPLVLLLLILSAGNQ